MTFDLFEQLARHAGARPNAIALQTVSRGTVVCLTFRELMEQSRALSGRLVAEGLRPGDRVALLLPNDQYFGVAFLAAASAGAVIVPLDPAQEAGRCCAMIAHAECRLLIASAAEACTIREQLPELAVIESPCEGLTSGDHAWPLTPRDPDADFLIMYTGGTTGAPKGVRLTLRGIVITILDTLAVFPLSEGDHVLSILPLFHIMAIQANLLGPLYAGAKVTYLQSRDPQEIVGAFAKHAITAFLCVPLFYYQLHRRIFGEVARQPWLKRAGFRSFLKISRVIRTTTGWNAGRILFRPVRERFGPQLRGFGVGAARFAPEVAADLHDLGFAFFQGYGMTETSGLAAISPMSMRGGLSSGRPLKNVEIRIGPTDVPGRGEILLRGANIMAGYWKDPEATEAALSEGWLHTGDIGELSGEEVHVIGRKKEVIVLSSGKNIFPEPLETWFQTNCPLIQEICVFGRQANGSGAERLHAVVVPDSVKLRELAIVNVRAALRYRIENLNRNLPHHEKLHGFDIRFEPLPRTSARKLQRFRIEEEFAGGAGTAVAAPVEPPPAEDASPAFNAVRELIGHIKPGREIEPSMNLELDLAFDSLERVELLSNLQERFELQLSPEQAAAIFTVADVMALARDHAPVQSHWSDWSDILREPLSEPEKTMAARYLGARPVAAPLFFLAARVFCVAAKVLLGYRVHGLPVASEKGPLIIAANHQSYLDFPLIAGSLPYSVFRRLFTLSTSRLSQSRFQNWFGRTVRSVPVDPDRSLRTALRLAFAGLNQDLVLCVFPEGHRSIDGELQAFRTGAAIIAVESRVHTIPAGITGTGRVWGRARNRIHRAPVSLEFGSGISAETGEDYASFNLRLQRAVQAVIRRT